MTWRLFPLLYLLVYGTLALLWPAWRTRRATGRNPIRLAHGDDAVGVVALFFRASLGACAVAAGLFALGGPWYDGLGRITWLEQPLVRWIAGLTLIASLAWTVAAQGQMGKSWRVGLDEQKSGLVTRGLFSRSRNPIFLGMRALLMGLFLAMPNALTLAIWAVGECAIQIQVRLEEAHLRGLHGAAYDAYRRQVPRWL